MTTKKNITTGAEVRPISNGMKKRFLASLLSLVIFFAFGAVFVHAQGTACGGATGRACPPSQTTGIKLDNPFSKIGDGGLLGLINAIIENIVLPIGGVLAVLAFIWTGFMFVMARGNPTAIGKAKDALIHTVIGTALLLGAYVISDVISGTLQQLGGPKL